MAWRVTHPTALQVIKDTNAAGTLKGKTILITGCSSGLSADTARAIYETVAKLFLTARDIPKLEKVIDNIVSSSSFQDTPRPEAVELHLDSLESVRKGAEDFERRSNGQLNILINNAGVMACPYSTTKDGFELQIGTNHFAQLLLVQLVKPLLPKSAAETETPSRIVSLASAGHQFGGVNLEDINYTKDPSSSDK